MQLINQLMLSFEDLFWLYIAVCNAGFYLNGEQCVVCPGHTIKPLPGNETDCDVDAACDGESAVANDNHTACGR